MNPVLYRYRDSESVIKAMEGYTPGEGWEPLYSQAQVENLLSMLSLEVEKSSRNRAGTVRETVRRAWLRPLCRGDQEVSSMTQGEQIEAEAIARENVLREVGAERRRQDVKWGGPKHDDRHSTAEFVQLIEDYAGWARTMAGTNSTDKARSRLVQVAALAVAAVESIDRAAISKAES